MLKTKRWKNALLTFCFTLLVMHSTLIAQPGVVDSTQEKVYMPLQNSSTLPTDASLVQYAAIDTFNSTKDNTDVSEAQAAVAPAIGLNKPAASYAKVYIQKENESLSKVKERCDSYFAIMDAVFRKYDLPVELKYLAVVESELKSKAVSRVGAKGFWQLMPSTARDLGLKVSHKHDERTYCYKSTVAAAKYLKDLYAQFGDWLLVVAAYNVGPKWVNVAIRKSGSRNFWQLQSFLPLETRLHVKRFIATHYFFEGQGSLATLTKAETVAYLKSLKTGADTKSDSFALTDLSTNDDNTFVDSRSAKVIIPVDYAIKD